MKNITSVNGKKLSKSQINLLAKLADKYGVTLAPASAVRSNAFSGVSKTLEPLAVSLFDFIIGKYRAGLVKGSTVASLTNPQAIPTNVWDSSRYFFLAFWPEEYYALID